LICERLCWVLVRFKVLEYAKGTKTRIRLIEGELKTYNRNIGPQQNNRRNLKDFLHLFSDLIFNILLKST